MEKIERLVRRGDIRYYDFGKTDGSEQSGIRPVLILQNDTGNRYSPTVIFSPITSKFSKKELPTHVELDYVKCGLNRRSQVLLESINTKDKTKLGDYIGRVDKETMRKINIATEISLQVGSAEREEKEIKVIKEKVEVITELDIFIRRWISFGRDINQIKEDMNERDMRIKDLEYYSETFGLNYKEYYNPTSIRGIENLNVMVG